MKRKLFCLLTLLLTVCSGAWAAEETWTTSSDASLTRTHFTVALDGSATQLGSGSGNRIKFAKNASNTMTISTNSGETLDGITFNWKSTPNSTATTSVTPGTWSTTSKNFDTWTKSGSTGPTTVTFTFQDAKDVEIQGITVTYTAGGGGGGATTYEIRKDTPSNGTISVDKATAAAGETVTLTATPADGYMLDAWDVYKTGESTTKVSVTDNKFTMPAYAVTVNATFVVDSRKKVLYVTSDGKVNAGDDLYDALNEEYNVTKIAYNGSATLTNYDLVVLHESIAGSNANTGLVAEAKTANVPVLNTKSYFYNDGRWDWGTPNAGKTVKVATLNSIAYSNIASHPIFAGITPDDGDIDVVGTAVAKAMQPVTDLVSGKEGYTLATTPNADSGNGTAIHELTPEMRDVSNAKYLMISVLGDCLNDLSANGVKLFKNAAAYLMDNSAQWVPAAASYTVTYDANGGSGSMDNSEGSSITLSDNTFTAPTGYTFDGWNTAANGSGTAYTAEQSGITTNLDLFAQWKQTVTLDKNGGTVDGSVVAHYNGTLGAVTAPTYADHTVTGYYNDAEGTTMVLNADGSFAAANVTGYITAGAWTHSGATTLYAQWEESASVKAEAPVYKLRDGGANVTEISANNYMFATASGTTKFRVKAQPYTYVRYTVGENEMPAAPTLTSGTEIKNQTGDAEKESSNIECSTHTKTYYVRAIAWDAAKTPESASDEVVLVVAANQVTVTIASACTYDGKFYATFSNDKAFVVPADLTVSAVGISDKKLVVTNYTTDDVVKANTGVMLSSETAGNKTITLSADTGIEKSGNYLKASSVAMTGENLFYRLTMHNPDTENKIGFWWGAEDGAAFYIAANKAYLAVPTGEALARGLWFDEGETTSLNEVRGLKSDVRGEYFNLNGQRVAQPTKGLYIVNGRKVVIK